jgi:lipopolysaccharide transport system ATP-binding protein
MRFEVVCAVNQEIDRLNVGIRLRNKEGIKVYSWGTLNQDIAIWAGHAQGPVFWERRFQATQTVRVLIEGPCRLGPNLYEVQASVSWEGDRYYGAQRILHWRDEAAFFHVNIRPREYFFGGVCDLTMKALYDS